LPRLSAQARRLIDRPDNELVVSTSLWQIAIKSGLGRPNSRGRADRGRLLLDEVRLAATRAGRQRLNAVLAALLS